MPQILVVGSVPGGDAKLLGPGHSSDIIELVLPTEVSTVCVITVRQLHLRFFVGETGVLQLLLLIELEGSNKYGACVSCKGRNSNFYGCPYLALVSILQKGGY